MEATATWMEEQVRRRRQRQPPVPPLRAARQTGERARRVRLNLNQYGNWAFFEYLSSRFGVGIVRSIWNGPLSRVRATGSPARRVAVELRDRGGLPAVFAGYAAGNTIPAHTYPEGSAWPAHRWPSWRLSADRPRRSTAFRIDHLSSRSARICPSALTRRRWRARISVDGPAAVRPRPYLIRATRERGPVGEAVHARQRGRRTGRAALQQPQGAQRDDPLANAS